MPEALATGDKYHDWNRTELAIKVMSFRHFFRREYFWVLIGLVCSLWLVKSVFGLLAANFGMLEFGHALIEEKDHLALGSYPIHATALRNVDYHSAKAWLQFARWMSPSPATGWKLIRLGLASGEQTLAMSGVQEMQDRISSIPLAYEDVLLTLGQNEQYQSVITLYEKETPQMRTMVLSDTVALAYLEQAKPLIDAGNRSSAYDLLAKAIRLRPFDLYANAQLYEMAITAKDTQASELYKSTLTQLSGAAVNPSDARLVKYVTLAIPMLWERHLWNQDIVNRVISSLIWLHAESPYVEALVFDLAAQQPDDSTLQFMLGELYQRQGKWQQAQTHYERTLAIDPEFVDAYLRLAVLCSKAIKECLPQQALNWYLEYLTRRPHDLLALRQTTSICGEYQDSRDVDEICQRVVGIVSPTKILAGSPADQLHGVLQAYLDDFGAISRILGISPTNIQMGEDLFEGGSFDGPADQLQHWRISDEVKPGAEFRNNAFVGGKDAIDSWGNLAWIRLAGLGHSRGMTDLAREWYGIRAWDEERSQAKVIESMPFQWYWVKLDYRTGGANDEVGLHLNQDTVFSLPATNGEWRHYAVIVCSPSKSKMSLLSPYIYLAKTEDQVWIDDFSVKPFRISTATIHSCSESPLPVQQQAVH